MNAQYYYSTVLYTILLQQKKYIYFSKVFLCDIKACCCNYQLFCQAQSVDHPPLTMFASLFEVKGLSL